MNNGTGGKFDFIGFLKGLLQPPPVSAVTKVDARQKYTPYKFPPAMQAKQDAEFKAYRDAQAARLGNAPTPTPTPTQGNSYSSLVAPTFKKYGVPLKVGFGIHDAEGGKINAFNLGAVDSNPGGAMRFPDQLSEATAAAQLMSKMAQSKGGNSNDPSGYLDAIQNAGYAGDPATWRQRSIATGGAGKTYKTWADFVRATNGYRSN